MGRPVKRYHGGSEAEKTAQQGQAVRRAGEEDWAGGAEREQGGRRLWVAGRYPEPPVGGGGAGPRGRVQVSGARPPPPPPLLPGCPAAPRHLPALAPQAGGTAGDVSGPGQVRPRLHLGPLRRAPVAAAGAALRAARAGERVRGPALCAPVGAGGQGGRLGRASPSGAAQPHLHPPPRSAPRHPGPRPAPSAPVAASRLPSLLSLPIPSPLPGLLCPSSRFSTLLRTPARLPPPLRRSPLPLPFLLLFPPHRPPALHPSPLAPQLCLPSVTAFVRGRFAA